MLERNLSKNYLYNLYELIPTAMNVKEEKKS